MALTRKSREIDLVVGPSAFNEDTRHTITAAIARYRSTGEKSFKVVAIASEREGAVTYRVGQVKATRSRKFNIKRKAGL